MENTIKKYRMYPWIFALIGGTIGFLLLFILKVSSTVPPIVPLLKIVSLILLGCFYGETLNEKYIKSNLGSNWATEKRKWITIIIGIIGGISALHPAAYIIFVVSGGFIIACSYLEKEDNNEVPYSKYFAVCSIPITITVLSGILSNHTGGLIFFFIAGLIPFVNIIAGVATGLWWLDDRESYNYRYYGKLPGIEDWWFDDKLTSFIATFSLLVTLFSLSSGSYSIVNFKKKQLLNWRKTTPELFDTAQYLSNEATKLFEVEAILPTNSGTVKFTEKTKKGLQSVSSEGNKYELSLEKFEASLKNFITAKKGAEVLKNEVLRKAITKNIYNVKKSIIACKIAIGTSLSEEAKKLLDSGDYIKSITTYWIAETKFEDALNDAKEIEENESVKKIQELVESTKITIDVRKVEQLFKASTSLHEQAAEHAKIGKMFRAKDILGEAERNVNTALEISTKRKFSDAINKLNLLLKTIRDEIKVIDEKIANGLSHVDFDKEVAKIRAEGEPAIEIPIAISRLEYIQKSLSLEKLEDNQSAVSDIKRGYVVLPNNDIKFGIRVTNNTGYTITDVDMILDYNEELFNFKDSKIQRIGNIVPNTARTATYILKPLGCIHSELINALITYKDHTGKKQTLHMRPKEVHCVCPFLKEKPMSQGEYSRLAASSEFVQEGISFKGIGVEDLGKFMGETCRHMLYKVKEYDIEGKKVIYLSGESIGEKAYYLLTAVIQEYKGLTQVVLRAQSDKKYGLNGFMNEMADSIRHLVGSVKNAKEIGIIENTQVINIIGSVVQKTNFNMGEGGKAQVNIKGSMVRRSTIGASARKCPDCGREVEANEKFCLECGAKL